MAMPHSPAERFDYLHFAKFLAYRNIEIIPPTQLNSQDTDERLEQVIARKNAPTRRAGGSAEVFSRVQWKSIIVAAKVPKMFSDYIRVMKKIFYESQIMSHKPLCDHPNIVKLLGLSVCEVNWGINTARIWPILIVEAAHSKYPDLEKYVEFHRDQSLQIPLGIVYEFIGDIADGLTALHNFGVVHGDIKPENILLFDDQEKGRPVLKLCDFGDSQVEISGVFGLKGTENWLPPQMERYGSDRRKVETTWDVFQFGWVAAYVASKGLEKDEFLSEYEDEPTFNAQWKGYIRNAHQTVSSTRLEPLFQLLEHALKPQPEDRLQSLANVSSKLLQRYSLPLPTY
jgi:serine/threonine protein kinase